MSGDLFPNFLFPHQKERKSKTLELGAGYVLAPYPGPLDVMCYVTRVRCTHQTSNGPEEDLDVSICFIAEHC